MLKTSPPPYEHYTRLPTMEEFFNNISPSIQQLDIHVIFSPKATNYIGKACFASPPNHRYTIYLARTYFKMIEVQAKEVLYHELAHIVAHSQDGTMEHNLTWRNVMKEFGYEFPKHVIIPLGN